MIAKRNSCGVVYVREPIIFRYSPYRSFGGIDGCIAPCGDVCAMACRIDGITHLPMPYIGTDTCSPCHYYIQGVAASYGARNG